MSELESVERFSIGDEVVSLSNSLSKSWVTLNDDSDGLNLPEVPLPSTSDDEKNIKTERSSSQERKTTAANGKDHREDTENNEQRNKENDVESEEARRPAPETAGATGAPQEQAANKVFENEATNSHLDDLNLPEITFPSMSLSENENASSNSPETTADGKDNREDKGEKDVEQDNEKNLGCEEAKRPEPEATEAAGISQDQAASKVVAFETTITGIEWMFILKSHDNELKKLEAQLSEKVTFKPPAQSIAGASFDLERVQVSVAMVSQKLSLEELTALWHTLLNSLKKLHRVLITVDEANASDVEALQLATQQEINKLDAQVFVTSVDIMSRSVGVAGPGTLPDVLRSNVLETLKSKATPTGKLTDKLAKSDAPPKVDDQSDTTRPTNSHNSDKVANAESASAQQALDDDNALKAKAKATPSTSTSNATVPTALLCPICKDELSDAATTSNAMPAAVSSLLCSHTFHADCLRNSLEYAPICPVCRTSVDTSNNDFPTYKSQDQQPVTTASSQPAQAPSAQVQVSTSSTSDKQQQLLAAINVTLPSITKSTVYQPQPAKSSSGFFSRLFRHHHHSTQRYLKTGNRIDILAEPNLVSELRETRNMPAGEMQVRFESDLCVPGYSEMGCIVVWYTFANAVLQNIEPGTPIMAYLPNVPDAHRIVNALQSAFEQRWTFFATGATTKSGVPIIAWGPVTHKTELFGEGAPTFFSYPDNGYLKRVTEELRLLGIPLHDN